jgi:hypothetical protein
MRTIIFIVSVNLAQKSGKGKMLFGKFIFVDVIKKHGFNPDSRAFDANIVSG